MIDFKQPFLQKIKNEEWAAKGISVSVLREDTIHRFINGNKWRKLKYNLVDLKKSGKNTLLTFGGAFSNHLVATAAASKLLGINAVGIVRGENVSNESLNFIINQGMKLHFISRSEYRNKSDEQFINDLLNDLINKSVIQDKNVFILPEGGSNAEAVKGTSEIMDEIPSDTDIIACACGTGATIAGISLQLLPHQRALGISALKSENYFENEIKRLGGDLSKIDFSYNYHFGGYAKKNDSLIDFCKDFSEKLHIPIEPVYTGKLFYAIDDMIRLNNFKAGTSIVAVHTGGVFKFDE